MVQKMGWTEGKGLGKDNAGITKHLWTKKRVDAVGIGAENSNDWGAHSVQTNVYNSLLSKLSVIVNNSDGSSSSSSDTDSDSSTDAIKKGNVKPQSANSSCATLKKPIKSKKSASESSEEDKSYQKQTEKSKGKVQPAKSIKKEEPPSSSSSTLSSSSSSSSSSEEDSDTEARAASSSTDAHATRKAGDAPPPPSVFARPFAQPPVAAVPALFRVARYTRLRVRYSPLLNKRQSSSSRARALPQAP